MLVSCLVLGGIKTHSDQRSLQKTKVQRYKIIPSPIAVSSIFVVWCPDNGMAASVRDF